MYKIVFRLMLLAIAFAPMGRAFADDPAPPIRLITVTGRGLIEMKPDQVRLSIALTSREAPNAGTAQGQRIKGINQSINLATTRALQMMQGLGISSATARMSEIGFAPAKESYAARTVSWPPVPLEQAQLVREKVGGDYTLLAMPESSKAETLKAQAMQKALKNAREKADNMAAALGAKVRTVWTITELPEVDSDTRDFATPGMLQFAASAQVSFALE